MFWRKFRENAINISCAHHKENVILPNFRSDRGGDGGKIGQGGCVRADTASEARGTHTEGIALARGVDRGDKDAVSGAQRGRDLLKKRGGAGVSVRLKNSKN